MHYIVTGGCGFIGSHLVRRLLTDDHQVTIIDDLSNATRERAPEKARLLVQDILAPGVLEEAIEQADGCFHLAAIVSVQKSLEAWRQTHQVNLGGMVALLDILSRHARKLPVVFASSAAVYGDCRDVPLAETASCTPLSAYGVDKLACEAHARVASMLHAIPTIGLRIFNVYGPGQDPSSPYSGVISIFADRMRKHEPVTIYGDGEQCRDFIYVDDVVAGLVASMQALERKTMSHRIFNVCTGSRTSINQLAQIIANLTRTRSAINHIAPRAGDIRTSCGNPASGRQALGLKAPVMLQDGLERSVKNL